MVLLWEVASSLQLLPGVWRKIEWRSLGWLSLGAGIATPIGVFLLASFSADTIRILIGIVVLLGSFLIWRGVSWAGQPSPLSTVATGLTFGILNGSTALGGPPVVLFYLATPVGAAVGRASIIAFFLATDAVAAGSQAIAGVLSLNVLVAASLFLPVVLVGAWIGARHFIRTDPEDFKRFSLLLLMGLGIVLLLRSTL